MVKCRESCAVVPLAEPWQALWKAGIGILWGETGTEQLCSFPPALSHPGKHLGTPNVLLEMFPGGQGAAAVGETSTPALGFLLWTLLNTTVLRKLVPLSSIRLS